MKNRLIFCSFFILILVAGGKYAAAALENEKYTEAEKIGFAFYQLADINPDFPGWVRNSPAFNNALPSDKVYMVKQDPYRLETGFFNFSPDEDFIYLDQQAQIRNYINLDHPKNNTFELFFTDDMFLYMPVQIGDIWIAVIPQQLEAFKTITVNAEDAAKIKKFVLTGGSYNPKKSITARFILRAAAADTSAPLETKGFELWPLLTDIAGIELWNGANNVFLWAYYAPWYVPPDQKKLLDLFGE